MNITQQGFRTNIVSTVFDLSGKMLLKMTLAYLLYYIAVIIIMIPCLIYIFGFSMDTLSALMEGDQQAITEWAQEYSQLFISGGFKKFIGPFVVVLIIIMIVYSWAYNLFFIISGEQIVHGKTDFGAALKISFSKTVWEILALTFIILLIFGAVIAIVAGIGTITDSGLAVFLFSCIACVFLLRFSLLFPALAHGEMPLVETFNYSLHHITWLRAMKLFGVGILAFVCILLAAVIVGIISNLFAMIPAVGLVFNQAINIFFGGYMTALMIAGMSGLYYRYAPDIDSEEMKIEDHLITEE